MDERENEIVCLACGHRNPSTAPRCEACGEKMRLPVCRRCGQVVALPGGEICAACRADSTGRLDLGSACPRCGLHNAVGQTTCAGCGTDLTLLPEEPPDATEEIHEPPRPLEPAAPTVPEPPLVGRDEEVKRLLDKIRSTLGAGTGGLVAVFGGPGMGRTRLLDHLARRLSELRPATKVSRVACRESSDEPYDPLPKLLQTRCAFEPGLDDIGKRIAVTRLVSAALGTKEAKWVTEVSHLLGHLAGIPFPQSPVLRSLEGDPQRLHMRIHRALQRFIEADAGHDGLVWIIDDLHHASSEALLLLADLVTSLEESSPFVIVAAGLPSLQGTLKLEDDWQVTLGPLDGESMARLFGLLLPGLPEPPLELTEAAVDRAKGNPASMRELARLLLESGVIDASTEPWRTDLSRLAASDLPVSLEDALRARRRRLDSRTRSVLECAAVIGEVFWDEAVLALLRGTDPGKEVTESAQIWPDDSETMSLESTLRRLEDAEFLIPLEGSEFPRIREYAFRHAGLRDQVYAEIDAARLRRYHLLAAQWFESSTIAMREQFLEPIAEHWENAGERHRAARVLIEAAGHARARSINQKAIRLFERGLAGLTDQDRILRMEALHDLGSVYELVGDYALAMERLTAMLRDAWALVNRGKAGAAFNKMGRIHRARGDYPAARAYLQRGLQLFRAADDIRGVASSLDDLGNLYWLLGHYQRALDHSAEALEIRRSLGDRRGEAVALVNIGHIEAARGYLSEADACYREALDIARGVGDRDTECKALNAIGVVFHHRRESDRAIELWRTALAIAEDIGDRRMQSFLLNNLGEVLTAAGDRAAAERYLLDCEALAEDRDDRRVLAEVYRNLGTLMMLHNEVSQARSYLERSLKTAREMGSKEAVGLALRGLGQLSGRTLFIDDGTGGDDAANYFQQAIEIFESIGHEVELAQTLNALGTYWLERDELVKAKDALARARDIFAKVESPERERLDATISDIEESVELAVENEVQVTVEDEFPPPSHRPVPDDTVPGIPAANVAALLQQQEAPPGSGQIKRPDASSQIAQPGSGLQRPGSATSSPPDRTPGSRPPPPPASQPSAPPAQPGLGRPPTGGERHG